MRRWLVIGGLVLVLGTAPAVALAVTRAGSTGGNSPVNCLMTRWTSTPTSATSSFTPISALTTNFTAIYPVSITASGEVQGRPVDLKAIDHWILIQTGRPGVIRVTPVGGHATPFTFTWMAPGSSAAVRGHKVTIDWRRMAAGSSTLVKADVAVTYRTDVCTGTA